MRTPIKRKHCPSEKSTVPESPCKLRKHDTTRKSAIVFNSNPCKHKPHSLEEIWAAESLCELKEHNTGHEIVVILSPQSYGGGFFSSAKFQPTEVKETGSVVFLPPPMFKR